jgi:hypothetical protein
LQRSLILPQEGATETTVQEGVTVPAAQEGVTVPAAQEGATETTAQEGVRARGTAPQTLWQASFVWGWCS